MFELEKLQSMKVAKTFAAEDVIIREGDTLPCSMYIVLKGKVAVYKNYNKPEFETLGTLENGDFFGETSLFLEEPHTITVVALESDTTVFEISQADAYELAKTEPEIFFTITKHLCERVQTLDAKLSSQSSKN